MQLRACLPEHGGHAVDAKALEFRREAQELREIAARKLETARRRDRAIVAGHCGAQIQRDDGKGIARAEDGIRLFGQVAKRRRFALDRSALDDMKSGRAVSGDGDQVAGRVFTRRQTSGEVLERIFVDALERRETPQRFNLDPGYRFGRSEHSCLPVQDSAPNRAR